MKIGEVVNVENLIMVREISDIVPARWDGMLETFVACTPDKATYFIAKSDNNTIAFRAGFDGKELLIDIL